LGKISPEKYNEIIKSIELKNVALERLETKVNRNVPQEKLIIKLNFGSGYRNLENNLVNVKTEISLTSRPEGDKRIFFKLKSAYTLMFESESPFTDEFFEVYTSSSLQLNTWPFFREIINNTTARMGISPLTLPLFKSFDKSEKTEKKKKSK